MSSLWSSGEMRVGQNDIGWAWSEEAGDKAAVSVSCLVSCVVSRDVFVRHVVSPFLEGGVQVAGVVGVRPVSFAENHEFCIIIRSTTGDRDRRESRRLEPRSAGLTAHRDAGPGAVP